MTEEAQSDASRGLRHALLGQARVAHIPGLTGDVAVKPISTVAIVGGGLMGTGIAIALLNAGLPVTLVETNPAALERATANIRKSLERDVARGRITQAVADSRIAALTPAGTLDVLGNVDLVIEAVFEDLDVKKQVFQARIPSSRAIPRRWISMRLLPSRSDRKMSSASISFRRPIS